MNQQIRTVFAALAGLVLLVNAPSPCIAQTKYELTPDSQVQPDVPKGEMLAYDVVSPHNAPQYPGIKYHVTVYVPAQYTPDKPACLCVGLDGPGNHPSIVFDNLIAKKQIPVIIGVFLSSGTIASETTKKPLRFDRCYEWDSTNGNLDRFLEGTVLPEVENHATRDGRQIHLSHDPNDRMIYGGSSGGVCAFTAAWQRPDLFRRVYSSIGTFVGMRGADSYPTLIRKTEPKPIRIFLQDGEKDSWNPLFDNWYTQNRSMEESLSWAGYDVNHSWGTLGHEGSHSDSVFPDAVKWLWRDYPQPIEAGWSPNSMLNAVLNKGEGWSLVSGSYSAPTLLTVSPKGEIYFADSAGAIFRLEEAGSVSLIARTGSPVTAAQFDKDGRLYIAHASLKRIDAIETNGKITRIAEGIAAHGMTVLDDKTIYAAEPGEHDELPSKIWRIKDKTKTLVDTGLHDASGIILTPEHAMLFAAEKHTQWVYTYIVQPDGTLIDKQRYYWLHIAESADGEPGWSDATDLVDDRSGYLYVATRMGVQICDRNGRVEGILTLPQGPVTSLAFGGPDSNILYVVSGGKVYRRTMAARGVPCFADPIPLAVHGGG
ncbi:MAG: SMP-30/gluconolactonase/LRE family protein [Capsulimonadaceae bacterium]|nr:SMP-30/gluconolactonase/LRE family protein [Capsulimonadaceae bacterium]